MTKLATCSFELCCIVFNVDYYIMDESWQCTTGLTNLVSTTDRYTAYTQESFKGEVGFFGWDMIWCKELMITSYERTLLNCQKRLSQPQKGHGPFSVVSMLVGAIPTVSTDTDIVYATSDEKSTFP